MESYPLLSGTQAVRVHCVLPQRTCMYMGVRVPACACDTSLVIICPHLQKKKKPPKPGKARMGADRPCGLGWSSIGSGVQEPRVPTHPSRPPPHTLPDTHTHQEVASWSVHAC